RALWHSVRRTSSTQWNTTILFRLRDCTATSLAKYMRHTQVMVWACAKATQTERSAELKDSKCQFAASCLLRTLNIRCYCTPMAYVRQWIAYPRIRTSRLLLTWEAIMLVSTDMPNA